MDSKSILFRIIAIVFISPYNSFYTFIFYMDNTLSINSISFSINVYGAYSPYISVLSPTINISTYWSFSIVSSVKYLNKRSIYNHVHILKLYNLFLCIFLLLYKPCLSPYLKAKFLIIKYHYLIAILLLQINSFLLS